MNLGLDFDGVISDTGTEFLYRIWHEFGQAKRADQLEHFAIEKNFKGITEEWVGKTLADPAFYMNCKPYEEAWLCLNHWFGQGHDVYIITARWDSERDISLRWLEEWDLPYTQLFTNVKKMTKSSKVSELNLDLMVEDRLEEATAIARDGRVSFLLNKPYNQGDTPAVRINSLWEVNDFMRGINV